MTGKFTAQINRGGIVTALWAQIRSSGRNMEGAVAFPLQTVVLESRTFFENNFHYCIREVTFFSGAHIAFDYGGRAVLLGNNQSARKASAIWLLRIGKKSYLQRRIEFCVLGDEDENARLEKSGIERSESVVDVPGVARQILADNLCIPCISYRRGEIQSDDIRQSRSRRQFTAQKPIDENEVRAGSFRIREQGQ